MKTRPLTLGQLQATIQHLLDHEGADPSTPVRFFVDPGLSTRSAGFDGPGGGRFIDVDLYDQVCPVIVAGHTQAQAVLSRPGLD